MLQLLVIEKLPCALPVKASGIGDTLRVQVAVNASPHLTASMRDEAVKGTENHPVHNGSPEERSVVALHGQRVAQQQVAYVHEETLDATEK